MCEINQLLVINKSHPWVLIGSHSHELCFSKDKGIIRALPQSIGAVVLGWDDMNTRLVLVH